MNTRAGSLINLPHRNRYVNKTRDSHFKRVLSLVIPIAGLGRRRDSTDNVAFPLRVATAPMNAGDAFRDHVAALLRTRYDNVRTEIKLTAKKADITFEIHIGPRRRVRVAAECKKVSRALTRDDVKDILNDYDPALEKDEIDEVWIICEQTPAPGAREYVDAYSNSQLMTAIECEQSLVDFNPLLNFLADDFRTDRISDYYIAPSFYVSEDHSSDLHSRIEDWLTSDKPNPIAIWAGYGMGKTSYARYLASVLAQKCLVDYGSRIPILLNLGDFTMAPDIETLVVTQLANFYGVRYFSAAAFRLLNARQRFILILDGFDEMKFAMAPNDFAFISAQMRKTAAVNPRLLLLGRPDAVETGDEVNRLTSATLHLQNIPLRVDDAPEFDSLRLAFLSKAQYLGLIENFLAHAPEEASPRKPTAELVAAVERLTLGDILGRPVQAKMLAEVVADPNANVSALSRFTLYDLFIKRILRREEEKSARRHLSTNQRIHFMRLLAWWLWTEKKTRTFAASEVPLEIIQKFQPPNSPYPIEGLRRELLIGSIIEEKNIGHFLTEKDAGIFYFPHTSFTEFLVSDYIMSPDFLSIDVPKLPDALYGEVPSFLQEHPSKDAIFIVYRRMKSARIAMTIPSLSTLLSDFRTRMHIELAKPVTADAWDICLHYFLLQAENEPVKNRQYLRACLESGRAEATFAAIYCLAYETVLTPGDHGSALAEAVIHVFRGIGLDDLISASTRGSTTARSREVNHLAEIVTSCIRRGRDRSVTFDFAEFSAIALSFVGQSCAVSDVIDRMRKSFRIRDNDMLALTKDAEERALLSEFLSKEGTVQVIASATSNRALP